jgi:hypothetical protein
MHSAMANTMRFFRNILLAVDGSPVSAAALAVVCSLARGYGGKVSPPALEADLLMVWATRQRGVR